MRVYRALHSTCSDSLNGCKSYFYNRFMNEKLELKFHQSGLFMVPIDLICISFGFVLCCAPALNTNDEISERSQNDVMSNPISLSVFLSLSLCTYKSIICHVIPLFSTFPSFSLGIRRERTTGIMRCTMIHLRCALCYCSPHRSIRPFYM